MKVGTDGVLLGAYASCPEQRGVRILDVGTGCGLIALMMAQKCPGAHIDAIDIDANAASQAAENFAASPWSELLHTHHCSLQEWQPEERYHLIVSNPPYFQNSLKNPDKGRQTARHTDGLSYEELIAHSARLLTDNGQLALILPADAETEVTHLAADYDLFPSRIAHVYSKETKPVRRVLLAFNRNTDRPEYRHTEISKLVLEDEKGGRSAAYSELCKEFYL